MAVAHENGVLPDSGPPRLGEILLERGLLTEEQLAYALGEGQRTGEPIGEVIVRLGFAVPATIAQALATQHGGPMKSEYGYAVGFAPPNASSGRSGGSASAGPGPGYSSGRRAWRLRCARCPSPLSSTPSSSSRSPSISRWSPSFSRLSLWCRRRFVQPVEPGAGGDCCSAGRACGAGGDPGSAGRGCAPGDRDAAPGPDPEIARLQAQVEELAGDLDAARRETRAVAAERSTLAIELESARARNVELEPAAAEVSAAERRSSGLLSRARLGSPSSSSASASLTVRLLAPSSSRFRSRPLASRRPGARVRQRPCTMLVERSQCRTPSSPGGSGSSRRRLRRRVRLAPRLRADNAEASQRSAEAEQRIAEAEARIAELEAERDELLQAPRASRASRGDGQTPDYADSTSHLLFVADHAGYHARRAGRPAAGAGDDVRTRCRERDGFYATWCRESAPHRSRAARSACAYVSAV